MSCLEAPNSLDKYARGRKQNDSHISSEIALLLVDLAA